MRCVVLRPHDQAHATAARLAALGHTALVAPLLTIAPTDEPPPDGPFAGIVLTSANALAGYRSLAGRAAGLPVWVVGARTAEALAQDGLDHVAWAGDAAALAALIVGGAGPSRLLLIGGRDRKAEPAATLLAAGFEVALWNSYEASIVGTLPPAFDADLRAQVLDVALHYSRRSAAAALALVDEAGLAPAFSALRHVCLSPDVAAALATLPRDRVVVAPQPDENSLLALIEPSMRAPAPVGSHRA